MRSSMNERAIILVLILMPLIGGRLGCGEGAAAGELEPESPQPPELSAILEGKSSSAAAHPRFAHRLFDR